MSESVNTPHPEGQFGTKSETESTGEPSVMGSHSPIGEVNSPPPNQAAGSKRRFGHMWFWLVGIACVLAAELYIYGHDGWVRVCVGLDGVTDLSLMDRPKHADRPRGFPICAEQLNLGMYSQSDDAAREALNVACARGAALMRGDKSDCLRKEHGWVRRVDKENIPPWDSRFYRRLFFID